MPDVFADVFRQPHVVYGVFRFHKRRCQVVDAIFHFHLEPRIRNHGLHQVQHHARRAGEKAKIASIVFPVPAIRAKIRRGFVALVLAEFQFLADVRIERAYKSTADGRILRVVIRSFADQVVGWPSEPRVQPAGGQSAIPLQFLHELEQTHAQVGFVEIVFTQSRESRNFLDDVGFFSLAERIAFHQRIGVFAAGEFSCFVEKCIQVFRPIFECFVEPRRCRIARQIKDEGEILPRIKRNCAQVQNRRNHHNSVQVHVVVALQVIGECRVAKRAIALANQEFRGIPPVVAADVSGYKLRQRFHIRVHAPKILVLRFADRVAETRSDGINKHEIGFVQQAIRVVHELVWCGWRYASVDGHHAPRPHRSHVQPNGR